MPDASRAPANPRPRPTLEQPASSRGERRLLPAEPEPSVLVAVAPSRSSIELPRRRPQVAVACDRCRQLKSKCDGIRPSCKTCQAIGKECTYQEPGAVARKRKHAELQRSHADLEDLIRAIQRLPEAEAKAIFERIRAGADVQSTVRQIKQGDVRLQLHVKPEARYRYEFPYRSKIPGFLSSVDNPYLGSVVYEGARLGSSAPEPIMSSANEVYQAEYLRPYHAATIVDSRLQEVRPSQWTNVSADDAHMRELLHLYLLQEYGSLAMFHKDYFLDGMLAHDDRLCSPILVNAVLAHASACHAAHPDRAKYWNPRNLSYQFFAETKRLWELERLREPSLTTVQAALVMTVVLNTAGLDKLGVKYLAQAAAMAHHLRLFDSSTEVRDVEVRNARDFTAWGLYHLQSIVCYSFRTRPMVAEPLKIPLPDVKKFPEKYGEIWIKYPLVEAGVPMHLGHTVRAMSEIAVIMSSIAAARFETDDETVPGTPRNIRGFITDLRRWYARLPGPLRPGNIIFPSQLKLHMFYHELLIHLHELLVPEVDIETLPDPAPTLTASPKLALDLSRICLETLLRLYYLRHGFNGSDTFLTRFLVLVASQSIARLKIANPLPSSSSLGPSMPRTPETTSAAQDLSDIRGALILAEKGLKEQGDCYFFAQTVFHLILNSMSPEDAQLVQHYTEIPSEGPDERRMRAEHVHSDFPIELFTITDDATSHSLSKLTEKYGEMTLQ